MRIEKPDFLICRLCITFTSEYTLSSDKWGKGLLSPLSLSSSSSPVKSHLFIKNFHLLSLYKGKKSFLSLSPLSLCVFFCMNWIEYLGCLLPYSFFAISAVDCIRSYITLDPISTLLSLIPFSLFPLLNTHHTHRITMTSNNFIWLKNFSSFSLYLYLPSILNLSPFFFFLLLYTSAAWNHRNRQWR